ncbi:MAG: hypothetical protein EPO11_00755, partial [Gammaproteobacteria bacterium]
MQERNQLKLDSLFTEKFFDSGDIDSLAKLDCPLPESAETLHDFFLSEEGIIFKNTFKNILDELTQWSIKNGLNADGLIKFKESYGDYSGLNTSVNELYLPLYQGGINALFGIVTLVKSGSIPLCFSKDIMKNLIPSLTVCAPGTYTNITNAYIQLASYVNLPLTLMARRRQIAEQFILEQLKPFKVKTSVEIHYVNGVINRFGDAIGIKMIEDEYVRLCDPDILDKIFEEFTCHIAKKISVESLIEWMIQELNLAELPNVFLETGGIARFE